MLDDCFVYRVENAEGGGMYHSQSISSVNAACEMQPSNTLEGEEIRHPTPNNDSRLREDYYSSFSRDRHIFGFASLAQLKSWIYKDEWRRSLQEGGFQITKYKVEEVYIGDTQVFFSKETAIKNEVIQFDQL